MIAIIGILAAVALPRFFSPLAFSNANERNDFQSALTIARNRAITAQCSIEIRLETTGWSAWRDQDAAGSCDSTSGFQSPAPACGDAPDYAVLDSNGSALRGDIGLDSSASLTLARLVFTPTGQVHLLTSECGSTLDHSNRPAPDSRIALEGGVVLRLDGVTGYAALL